VRTVVYRTGSGKAGLLDIWGGFRGFWGLCFLSLLPREVVYS